MRPNFEYYGRAGLLGSASTPEAILGRSRRILRAYFEELAGQTAKAG